MMNAQTKMSGKGQIVIPKDVRDRLHFEPGDKFEIVERLDGVLLRREVVTESDETFEQITARIHARLKHDGPPLSIEDMNLAISKARAEHVARRDDRARD